MLAVALSLLGVKSPGGGCQLGEAAAVAMLGVVAEPPAQHNGPRQVHGRAAVAVQHRAIAAYSIKVFGVFKLLVIAGLSEVCITMMTRSEDARMVCRLLLVSWVEYPHSTIGQWDFS